MNTHNFNPTFEEIIETLRASRDVCSRYEKKYNMLSEQFHELYSQGLLDDDGLNHDFTDWAGTYKTVLACQREYANLLKQSTPAEKISHLRTYALVA
jgi:hypothetical protein